MFDIPTHIKKLTKEYAAGNIKSKDVVLTSHASDVTKDKFEFTLPTFTRLGDSAGEHKFSLSVELLVAAKVKVLDEFEAHAAQVDAFIKDYDDIISILNAVKTEKNT